MADETLDNVVDADAAPAPAPAPAPAVKQEARQEAKQKARATEAATTDADEETPAAPVKKRRAPSPAGAAVSGQERDTVSLAACVFKNRFQKKSLSVHHVQRRLAELGYPDAYTDKDGWYGDLTAQAVRQYQGAEGIEGDGAINMETLRSLFDDDRNVVVTD